MYKHDENEKVIKKTNENENDEDETFDGNINDEEESTQNATFCNPSQDVSKPFKCDLCDFESEIAYCVENHKSKKHPLHCPYSCPGVFISKSQCRKHVRQIHYAKP